MGGGELSASAARTPGPRPSRRVGRRALALVLIGPLGRCPRLALLAVGIGGGVAACQSAQPMAAEIPVFGMVCESCSQAIEQRLSAMEGVASCRVDLSAELAHVEYDTSKVELTALVESIEAIGYATGEARSAPRKDAAP